MFIYISSGDGIESDEKLRVLDGEQLGRDSQHLRPVKVRLRIGILEVEIRVPGIQTVNLVSML